MYVAADGSGEPIVLIDDNFANEQPQFSPDNRFIVFERGDASHDIHVVAFPEGGNSWQVTVDGGNQPVWSANSDRVFYAKDGIIWVVDIETSPTVRIGTPRPLSASESDRPLTPWVWPSPDGSRVLIRQAIDPEQAKPLLRIVENWYGEFGG
jgi:Tol biopolymer transport system component